jgi:hypothetical protein
MLLRRRKHQVYSESFCLGAQVELSFLKNANGSDLTSNGCECNAVQHKRSLRFYILEVIARTFQATMLSLLGRPPKKLDRTRELLLRRYIGRGHSYFPCFRRRGVSKA